MPLVHFSFQLSLPVELVLAAPASAPLVLFSFLLGVPVYQPLFSQQFCSVGPLDASLVPLPSVQLSDWLYTEPSSQLRSIGVDASGQGNLLKVN